MRRRRHEMRLLMAVAGLILLVSVVLLLRPSGRVERREANSTPAPQLALQPATEEESASPAAAPTDRPGWPSQSRQEVIEPPHLLPSPASQPAPQARPEKPKQQTSEIPETQSPPAAERAPGSDRYPGSQPVNLENVNLPDIGVPIENEVYTTPDSLPTVIAFYRQLYPDAQQTEVNGQTVLAVNRPGAAEVIALGTAGSETRIAIVRQK
jgi:hypothetical protein